MSPSDTAQAQSNVEKDFLTVVVAGQQFGIPILQIQDVLGEQKLTTIPLSPDEISGSLNLRGRIVTAIDVCKRLGISTEREQRKTMSVVVEYEHELYSLIIDQVGDVMKLEDEKFEQNPATLDPVWKEISMGVYRLENDILVILDVPKLINTVHT